MTPRLFFTSDLHFDHRPNPQTGKGGILAYCPSRREKWNTVEEMNEGLIQLHNEVVGPDDWVLYLGDFAMGKRAESVQHAKRLNGRWHGLICGNHDNPWEKGRDGAGTTDAKHLKHLRDYFEWGGFSHIHQPPVVCGSLLPGLPDAIHNLILSHLPPRECEDPIISVTTSDNGDVTYSKETRFADQRPDYPPDDTWMLCGHVHEAWKVHGHVINVGVDVWDHRPVSVEQLLEIMKGGTSVSP